MKGARSPRPGWCGAPGPGPVRPVGVTGLPVLLFAVSLALLSGIGMAAGASAGGPAESIAALPSPCALAIVAPRETDVLYGATEILAEASCPDGSEAAEVLLLIDGAVAARIARAPYRAIWDAGGSFAPHLIEARLTDLQGRTTTALLPTPGASLRESARVAAPPLEEVDLSVTVTDREGRPLPGLTRDDFEVEEEGRRQRVLSAGPDARPLSVAVVLDVSSSTAPLWDGLREAAPLFAGSLGPGDAAKVIAFSGRSCVVQEFTRDPGEMTASMARSRRWGGGTSLYDTLAATGVELAWERGGRQAVILLTDGIDTLSRIDVPRVRRYLRRTEVSVETLLLRTAGSSSVPGSSGFERDIEALSHETGGSVRVVSGNGGIAEAFRHLGEELRSRYLVVYHADRPAQPGAWRSIAVRSRRPGALVRSRAGATEGGDIVAELVGDLRKGDGSARVKAAEWLGTIGSADRPPGAERRPGAGGALAGGEAPGALIEALRDRSAEVRAAAAVALGRMQEPLAMAPLIGLLRERDPFVRKAASVALRSFGPAAVGPLIDALAPAGPDLEVAILEPLAEIGDGRAFEPIARLARPPVPLTATDAREPGEGDERARRPEPRVRVRALWALGRMARPEAVSILVKAVSESDPRIRQAGLRALGESGSAAAIPALLQAVGTGDPDREERAIALSGLLACVRSLGRQERVRSWALSNGGGQPFLAVVEQALAQGGAVGDALLQAMGGADAVAALLGDLGPSLPSDRVGRALSLLGRPR